MCVGVDGCVGVPISLYVCVYRKRGGASTLVRHKNYACPLVCWACCFAFVGEVNFCGSVSIFRRLIVMPAIHEFLIFQMLNKKTK